MLLTSTDPATQLVAVTAEFLVDSINGMVEGGNISKEFIGLILLPIVGNAAGALRDLSSLYGLRPVWPLPPRLY